MDQLSQFSVAIWALVAAAIAYLFINQSRQETRIKVMEGLIGTISNSLTEMNHKMDTFFSSEIEILKDLMILIS